MSEPKVGQYLYASCSAIWFGPITRVGKDDNDCDVIDFIVDDINEFITCDRWDDHDKNDRSLMMVDPCGPVKFVDVQWERHKSDDGPMTILCNTPGDGCRRCTGLFMVTDKNNYDCSPWNDGVLSACINKLFNLGGK